MSENKNTWKVKFPNTFSKLTLVMQSLNIFFDLGFSQIDLIWELLSKEDVSMLR